MSESRIKRLEQQLADEPKDKLIGIIDRLEAERDTLRDRLDIRQDDDGSQHDEIDRLRFTLELADQQYKSQRDAMKRECDALRAITAEMVARIEELVAGPLDKPQDYCLPQVVAALNRTITKARAALSPAEPKEST